MRSCYLLFVEILCTRQKPTITTEIELTIRGEKTFRMRHAITSGNGTQKLTLYFHRQTTVTPTVIAVCGFGLVDNIQHMCGADA